MSTKECDVCGTEAEKERTWLSIGKYGTAELVDEGTIPSFCSFKCLNKAAEVYRNKEY